MTSNVELALRVIIVFLAASIFYGMATLRMTQLAWTQLSPGRFPEPRLREMDPKVTELSVNTSTTLLPRIGAKQEVVTATEDRVKSASIPPALYSMAKPVFDSLPDRFLPDYKSSCWMVGSNRTEYIRCLPYFYILGMPKCGTSDLWAKIIQHPQVYGGISKESHWWTRMRLSGQTFKRYLDGRSEGMANLFRQRGDLRRTLVAGDASASTLWDNHEWRKTFGDRGEGPDFVTADIIHAVQPDARLIVILREPVSRLYSGYLYFRSKTTPENFHQNVLVELERYKNCRTNFSSRACAYTDSTNHNVRLTLGLYSVFLRDWLRVFPRRQLLVLQLDNWQSNCSLEIRKVYDHLNLDSLQEQEYQRICSSATRNSNTKKKKLVCAMLSETKEILHNFYAEHNKELGELLGDDHFAW